MNLQQIDYIIAVGELRHFGQAAEKCFITQSTLSTMIGRFEEEIGILIFDRKTKPVTITKEGVEIIQQLKVVAKELENLEEVVQTLKGEISGTLKIGVIPTIAPYLLPLFLNNFIEQLPKVHFVVSEMTTEQIIEKISTRDIDIGIASIPLNNPTLVERPLYEEPFFLYDKSNDTPSGNFKLADIDFDRLWLLEDGHCMRTQVESICGLQKRRPTRNNLDYQSGTIDTLLKFVNSNNGMTFLPHLATLDLSEQERLHLKTIQAPVPVRIIGLLTHRNFVKKGLLDLLEEVIQKKVKPLIVEQNRQQLIISPLPTRKEVRGQIEK